MTETALRVEPFQSPRLQTPLLLYAYLANCSSTYRGLRRRIESETSTTIWLEMGSLYDLVIVTHYLGQPSSPVITGMNTIVSLGTFCLTLAGNTKRITPFWRENTTYVLIGLNSTFWPRANFCGTSLPHCLSNLNRLTLSMIKLWLFAITLSNCLSQNSQNLSAKYRFTKILRMRCRMLREGRFGSHYKS